MQKIANKFIFIIFLVMVIMSLTVPAAESYRGRQPLDYGIERIVTVTPCGAGRCR